ncbi:zinc finger protein 740-like [Periplaneta americana]|uniref:zinc finger protein 740-like n=1 Tax=Periplaneta americana TaxID=6978 RepID=UPI0037E79F18
MHHNLDLMKKTMAGSSSCQDNNKDGDCDSDSESESSSSSHETSSSKSEVASSQEKETEVEKIEVKVDPSSCTNSDLESESETPDTEGGRQWIANGAKSDVISPENQNKKIKLMHASGSTIVKRDASSQTVNKRKVVQHECVFCGKTFRDRYHLTRHLLVHSGDIAPDCELCKTPRNCCGCVPECAQYSLIKQHKCEVCNKLFRDKYHLNRHSLVHTKEKPFHCKMCNKKFSRKDKLMQHSLSHY